ncbi:AmpG protein, beta-lactamase induction signal transducer [Enhygromyxa salina]|uniref:AmpG protein, beta-lactamase induction signal transducer n=1 Tax=Enhygromyxa salina TaxID=215803 RepID=A0A0C1ZW11_9BACT|nr:AmpG protein, beta-lactamase induction signal transducer [Enhygromyxa salina]
MPTAYLAEGIPFAMVIWVAGTLFKDLGHSDGAITVALASIGLAWSLKPFWAAFLDMFRTKRFFVLTMELLMAVLLGLFALALPLPNYFQVVIAILWVLAFASATQDICVDGIYITSLDPANQAKYIGVQGMAWNVGRIFATAGVVWIAGTLQEQASYAPKTAWAVAMGLSGATMAALALYHFVMLPPGSKTTSAQSTEEVVSTFKDTVRDFFRKDKIWGMLAFVFLFRSAEGLLLIEAPLFIQAPLEEGGLGLTLVQKGLIDGTISTAVSIVGGLLGGVFVSRYGLARSLFFLALCLNVPNLCYVYLSWAGGPEAPLSMQTIAILITIEKFGYSFGFVGNMLYMMQQISPGRYHMTHYAFCTALMNLVLIPTQMASGPLADWMGYRSYFIFVVVATIPSLVAAKLAPFPRDQATSKQEPP